MCNAFILHRKKEKEEVDDQQNNRHALVARFLSHDCDDPGDDSCHSRDHAKRYKHAVITEPCVRFCV